MGQPARKSPEKGKPTDDAIQKVIVTNRRATFDYAIEDKFEGGLVLLAS